MSTEQEFRAIADKLVVSMIGEEMAPDWWQSANKAFGGRTPEKQWELGSDAVVNYLMQHAFGRGS